MMTVRWAWREPKSESDLRCIPSSNLGLGYNYSVV